jgi:Holliday junction resolvase-like predicted endonuclease
MEIDILLANDKAAVVVEVKTTLKVADVRAF